MFAAVVSSGSTTSRADPHAHARAHARAHLHAHTHPGLAPRSGPGCGCTGFVPPNSASTWAKLQGRNAADARAVVNSLECKGCGHTIAEHRELNDVEKTTGYIKRFWGPRCIEHRDFEG